MLLDTPFSKSPIDKPGRIGYPIGSDYPVTISYLWRNEGNMQSEKHVREQPVGERLYAADCRLTPERKLFEWALSDANKSGTAECYLRLLSYTGDEGFLVPGKG